MNLLRRQHDSYGAYFRDTHLNIHQENASLIPNLMDDEKVQPEEEKDGRDEGWLQLGIGSRSSGCRELASGGSTDPMSRDNGRREGTMELNLFSDRPPATVIMSDEINPVQFMRVVSPPPRPQIGMWFVLRPAENQVREPFLPQISKSYLRIKDGRMTVGLLMKYIANKLGLENDESQVEITCGGQQLPPFLTLQYVRDSVWHSRSVVALPADSTSTDHLMILQYSRRA